MPPIRATSYCNAGSGEFLINTIDNEAGTSHDGQHLFTEHVELDLLQKILVVDFVGKNLDGFGLTISAKQNSADKLHGEAFLPGRESGFLETIVAEA